MHWRKYYQADWLMAGHLDGKERTVRIESEKGETVNFAGGKKKAVVLRFAGIPLPYVPGPLVCGQISKALGSPNPCDWIGKSIVIYPTITRMKGEDVECIRVRKASGQAVPVAEEKETSDEQEG